MLERMNIVRSVVLAASFLFAAACGPSDYNKTCSSTSDCKSGLMCPTVGPMAGKCTRSCTKDEECADLGSNLVCTSDVCTPK